MTYPARCADTPPHAEGNSNYNGRAMSAEDIERTVAAEAPMAKAGRGRGLTWRAAIIGGLLVVFISIWSQYAELVIHGTQISLTYPPIGAFLVFFALILVVQWPLQVWGKVRGGQARRLPHAEEGNDGYGQAGPLPHAEEGNDGYGQAGPLPHAEKGNDGYGQAGPLPHAEERNDGYGQAGPLPHAEEGNDGYGQAGPLPHAAGRGYALSARELVIIWSMLSLAIGVASIDIAQKMPPMIAGPIYYASEENHYEDLFLPHVAKWLQPQDAAAVQGMFEGSAQPVPWDVWLLPLVLWSLFFVVAYWVMLCGVALFQRQWVAHERLLFPLVQVPLQVIEAPEPGRAFNAFFRNKLVWLGIALGALPHLYTGLHDYFPTIPQADVFLWGKRVFQGGLGRPWTPLSNLLIGILPLIIGLSFLLTREISFSLWAFYLLGKAEAIFGAALGIDGLRTATGTDPFPFPGLQTAGAYIGLAAVSVWVARKGLWEAIRRPVGGQARRLPHANSSHADGMQARRWPHANSSHTDGMQARRWPHADGLQAGMPRGVVVYGGGIGFVALIVFCVAAGMPVRAALVVMGASFVYLLAMTRLVAEGGMPWCAEPDFRGHNLMLALFPGGSLRMPQIVAGGMMLTFSHDLRVAPMPRFMQSFKMTAETGTRNRDLVAALGLTLAIALPVSVWALIKDAYLHGGIAINPYRFVTLARAPGLFMEKATTTAHPHVDLPSLAIIGYGAGKLLLLNALRTYYLWWPLHPVGYAMSFVVYLHKEWFSVLIGWAVQTLIIRYGGHKGYQTARPLFLGLILGAMIAGGFWLVLDGFTGLRDHKILY